MLSASRSVALREVFLQVTLVAMLMIALVAYFSWDRSLPDVNVYWAAGQRLRQGAPLYALVQGGKPFIYPPAFAALFALLGALTPTWGYALWMAAQLLLVRWTLAALSGLGGLDQEHARWMTALCALVLFTPLAGGLQEGQANVLVLCVVVTGLHLVQRGADVVGGLLLALAVHLKVLPLVLLPVLLLLGRRGAARWMLVSLGAFTLVPLPFFIAAHGVEGVAAWLTAHVDFVRTVVFPALTNGTVAGTEELYTSNHAIRAVLHRLFSDTALTPGPSPRVGPLITMLPRPLLTAVASGISAVMLALVLWQSHRLRGVEAALLPAGACAWLAVQLGSVTCWEHHLVSVALLLVCGVVSGRTAWWRAGVAVLVFTLTLPMAAQLAGWMLGRPWSAMLTFSRDSGLPLVGVVMVWMAVFLQMKALPAGVTRSAA